MSGTANGASTTAPVQVVRTNYFTYSQDSVPHRDTQQVWNVTGVGSVWVQGNLPTDFGSQKVTTYFAKKHLITFEGGKQSKTTPKGTPELKAARVSMKRTKGTLSNGDQKRKKKKIGDKYGAQLTDANTVLICDTLVGDELKKLFAEACKAAQKNADGNLIATVTLPGDSVKIVTNGATIAPVANVGPGDKVDVLLKILAAPATDPTKWAVIHLEGCQKSV